MSECPTCSEVFEREGDMKRHHARVHGESIAYTEFECEWCGGTVKRYDSRVYDNTKYCSYSCRNSAENSGKDNWNWNGGKDEKECQWCGTTFESYPWANRKFCSNECAGEWRSENFSGDQHWDWKDDQTDYYGEDWYEMRGRVRERDVVCQKCGADGSDDVLDVHHIVPRREFDNVNNSNTMDNLILLCRSCHSQVEKGGAECPQPKDLNTSG